MKKLLFLTTLLVLAFTQTFADENISVESLAIPQGKQAEMVVNFNFNETHEYVSYQFTVELPEGVSLLADEYGKAAYTLPDNQPAALFNVDFLASNGIVKVYSSPSTPISGSTGVLIRIPVEASEELEVGTPLSGKLKDVEFTKNTGAVRTPFADASISITIAEPRLVFDENSVTLPSYINATKDNVRMVRTIKAGRWNTICLPFTLTKAKAEAVFPGVELAEFTGFETEYTDDDDVTPDAITLNFATYTMTTKKGLTGGKPFLIKVTEDVDGFDADDVTLVSSPTDVVKADEYETSGSFVGTFVKTTVPADGLFLTGNNFWYSVGKSEVKAFRAWFELGAVLDKETDFGSRIMLNIIDEATGISTPPTGASLTNSEEVYNLNGQRVSKTGRGIYIVNGKKVIKNK